MSYLLHGHHEGLITFDREYDERKAQILAVKPESEHAIRLARMRVLTNDEIAALPPEVRKARAVYDKAGDAYVKAGDASNKAWAARVKARDKAWAAYDKADAAYAMALQSDAMVAWHARVCSPECKASPSNNWSIFAGWVDRG